MRNPLAFTALALGLAFLVQTAQAQSVVLPVQLSGGANTTLELALVFPSTPVFTEIMANGTRHDRFDVSFGGSFAPPFALGGGGYYPDDLAPPARVDAYLSPSGSSSLALEWGFGESCHGGCRSSADLQLLLESPNASLFSNPLTSATFLRYAQLTGQVSNSYESFIPPYESYVSVSAFTATAAVPEPTSAALMLAGLAAVGGLIGFDRRRQSGTQAAGEAAST
jgi:hypothetical protein